MSFKIFLDAAQNNKSINLSGRRIEIIDASSADAVISLSAIYPSGKTRAAYDFKKEYKAFSAEPFSDLRVTHEAQPGEWVEIEVTQYDDEWKYERRNDVVVDEILSAVAVKGGESRTSAQVSVNAAGNAELILAANLSRTAWTVFNPSYAEILYIGKVDTVTTATGYPILPRSHGGGIDQDAIYGCYATETNSVPVMEATE